MSAAGPTPAAVAPSSAPALDEAERGRRSTGRSHAPSQGPTELGEARLSALESVPQIRVRRSGAGPVVALGLLALGAVATIVAYVLSQGSSGEEQPLGLVGGGVPAPLPPVTPIQGPSLDADAGSSVAPNVADGGALVTVRGTSDGGAREPGPSRDPPHAGAPRCPGPANQQIKAFAGACARHLLTMDSFSISYTIDQTGRARVTFGGSPSPAFRGCMIDQAANLRAPAVEQQCRGRFTYP